MNAAATPFAQTRALGNVAQRQLGTRLPYRITTTIGGRSSVLDARPVGFATRPDNYNLNLWPWPHRRFGEHSASAARTANPGETSVQVENAPN